MLGFGEKRVAAHGFERAHPWLKCEGGAFVVVFSGLLLPLPVEPSDCTGSTVEKRSARSLLMPS